ncbi:MAG: TerB family tellurite resistance protein [Alphaproteobacteria bacterium]|nr:TerB family tellurite resistance protein [Alphaproteobacteria bacterium]
MHILGALLGVIGVIAVVLWRLNQAADVARGVGDAVDDVHGAWRRWSWRRKSSVDQLRDVDDPRVAAAVMMVAVAEYDGALTEAERQTMIQQMGEVFGASHKQAEELVAHARWLNRNGGDIGSLFLKLTPVVSDKCGPKERRELIAMLRQVDSSGSTSEVPTEQIAKLEAQLKRAQ